MKEEKKRAGGTSDRSRIKREVTSLKALKDKEKAGKTVVPATVDAAPEKKADSQPPKKAEVCVEKAPKLAKSATKKTKSRKGKFFNK